jgi:tripartite-type tricarboxylate transporter receptor subunit TctC
VPAGTPKPIIDRLAAGIEKAMKASDIHAQFAAAYIEPEYVPPQEFGAYLKVQRERYADIIKRNNIRIE